MPQRYVFWRDTTGAAYRNIDGKYAPCRLLAEIGQGAAINAEGNISWSVAPFLHFEQAVLGSVVVLGADGRELNQHDSHSIVRAAMRKIIKRKGGHSPVEPGALLHESDNEAAAYFRNDLQRFNLVTSIAVDLFPAKRMSIGTCSLVPLKNRDQYPLPDVLRHEVERTQGRNRAGAPRHQLVRVCTTGRSSFDAADRALEAASLLCGLWNLLGTRGTWSIGSGSHRRRPIGVVHLGPFHTLHTPDGMPVGDMYWYEPDYGEHPKPFRPSKGWEGLEKRRRWAMRKLQRSPLRFELTRLILRYAGALSKSDPNVAFLQLWSILEKITGTVGAKYDDTIRRATWIFPDGDTVREVLEYLRRYRNQYVHAARLDDGGDQIAQLIKFFIDPHLLGLLRNYFKVGSIEEYAAYLSLPTSVDELKKRRQRHARAIAIRRSWETGE